MSALSPTLSRTGRVLLTAGAIAALVFGTALSASAMPASPAGPVNTAAPAITGTPHVGQYLYATLGTWEGENFEGDNNQPTYVFSEGDAVVQDSNSNRLLLQARDLGKTVTVTVTVYTGSTASEPATSVGVTIVTALAVTAQPVLSGSAQSGSTLSVTPGSYSDPEAVVTYQWDSGHPDDPIYGGGNGGPIDGATASTYVLVNADITNFVQINVIATSANGDSVTTTLRTATVVSPAAPFATDAGLTSANQYGVTGSVTATTATITLPGGLADGTEVYVYGYSTPTPLGSYRVVNGHIVVNFAALPAGAHKLLVIGPAGQVLGWFGVSVLAATGATVDPMEWYLAGGALLLGGLLVGFGAYTRRRRAAL